MYADAEIVSRLATSLTASDKIDGQRIRMKSAQRPSIRTYDKAPAPNTLTVYGARDGINLNGASHG